MSRASIKELQSLALFGWDRQHDHAPNGELLNMPSHDEHTRFYQSGRHRRKRSSGIAQAPSGHSTPAHPSKSKPRRSSTGMSAAKLDPVSQKRKSEETCFSCGPSTGTELSPVKTSSQVKCAAYVTPSVMENSGIVHLQGDRTSSQSTTGVPSTRRFSACTPNLQGAERSECSLPKQGVSAHSAGCTIAQSTACKWDVTEQFTSMPPTKSPLHSEYTPFMQPLTGDSSASALPAGAMPASPSSAICAPSAPNSPLSLTHDQENRPPREPLSPKPQSYHEPTVSTARRRSQDTVAVLEETSACAAGDQRQTAQPSETIDVLLVHDCSQLPQDCKVQGPFSGVPTSRLNVTVQCTEADELPSDVSRLVAMPMANSHVGEAPAPGLPSCDNATVRLEDPEADQPQIPALRPPRPDRPSGRAAEVAGGMQHAPAAVAGPTHTAEAACPKLGPSVEANGGRELVPGAAVDGVAEPRATSKAAQHQQQAQSVLSTGNASYHGQQRGLLLPQAQSELAPSVCIGNSAPFSCAELQRQLDRHAMPPPKPKRARMQWSAAYGREQSRPCEAAGFWQDGWGGAGVEMHQLPLFLDSYHLPLFQPSPSLPSGNPWILTFLP